MNEGEGGLERVGVVAGVRVIQIVMVGWDWRRSRKDKANVMAPLLFHSWCTFGESNTDTGCTERGGHSLPLSCCRSDRI